MTWTEQERRLPSASQICARFCKPETVTPVARKAWEHGLVFEQYVHALGQVGQAIHRAIEVRLTGQSCTLEPPVAVLDLFSVWEKWRNSWEGLSIVRGREELANDEYRSVMDALIEVDGVQYVTDWVTSEEADVVRQLACLAGTWSLYVGAREKEASTHGAGHPPGMCLVQLKRNGPSASWFVDSLEDIQACLEMFRDYHRIYSRVGQVEAIAMRSKAD